MEDSNLDEKVVVPETLIVTASLQIISSLLSLLVNKVNSSDASYKEAMENLLFSIKQASDLIDRIKEKQNEIDSQNINISDWNNGK